MADHTINKRSILASAFGNVLEWYDFIIFASLSPILAQIFFPESDAFIALLLTFTIFAMSFITRPFGGLVFGHIADKHGRKLALVTSILLMGFPAVLIGFMPTYSSIGYWAPLLLLFLRLLQGFSAGGEYPALVTYIAELAPSKHRGFWGSFANVTTVSGVFLATVTVAILSAVISEDDMLAWGWRIPFFITVLSVAFGFWLRVGLIESPIFQTLQTTTKAQPFPILDSLRHDKLAMLKTFLFLIFAGLAFYTFNVYTTTHLVAHAGFSQAQALQISLLSIFLLVVLIPLGGFISDLIGRRLTLSISLIGIILFSYPLFLLFDQLSFNLTLLAQFGFAILLGLYFGTSPTFTAEQMPAIARCTSVALAYNLAISLFGGTAPAVNLYLINYFNNATAPAFYLMLTAVICLSAVLNMKETQGQI